MPIRCSGGARIKPSDAGTGRSPRVHDYSKEARCTALGARLRRLSEQIERDCGRVYALNGVDFEQRWFGVLNQLKLNGPLSIGNLATLLGITHVSVTQTCQSLKKAGLIASASGRNDARVREVRLSKKGLALIEELAPLWTRMNDAGEKLNQEAGDVIAFLDRLEETLKEKSLLDRILDTP